MVGRAEPAVGQPLTGRQVAIAVSGVVLFLLFIIWMNGREGSAPAAAPAEPPVVGRIGQPVTMGATVWGVAFSDQLATVDGRAPQRGRYLAVGVIVGNRSDGEVLLSTQSVALMDRETGRRYAPVVTAWGTPETLNVGQYQAQWRLPGHESIAGVVIFDVPPTLEAPHLLVRDLTRSVRDESGLIELAEESGG
jgi:hypothetical protein